MSLVISNIKQNKQVIKNIFYKNLRNIFILLEM